MRRNDLTLNVMSLVGALMVAIPVGSWAMPVPSRVEVGEGEVREILEALEARMKGVNHIQTHFTQTKRVPMLKHEIVLEGSAYMKKPGRFAWHTTSPMRNSIVLNDDVVRQWNEDTDEVETMSVGDAPALKAMIDHTQTWFYGSYVAMLEEYEVRVLARQPLTLEFRPRAQSRPAAMIERVVIQFQPDESYIRSMDLLQRNGTQSVIRFDGTVLNGELDESVWEVRRTPG